jgi:hypothetical protein
MYGRAAQYGGIQNGRELGRSRGTSTKPHTHFGFRPPTIAIVVVNDVCWGLKIGRAVADSSVKQLWNTLQETQTALSKSYQSVSDVLRFRERLNKKERVPPEPVSYSFLHGYSPRSIIIRRWFARLSSLIRRTTTVARPSGLIPASVASGLI